MDQQPGVPILLTPGPLTTSRATKEAMLRDWGSRDKGFSDITKLIREELVHIIHGEGSFECVPLQGSGTFSVEAAIGTLVPPDGHVLVPINGAYCARIGKICQRVGRKHTPYKYAENRRIDPQDIDRLLTEDPSITHVALVHCETSIGILNPLEEISQVVARHGKRLIVDAMSSFGSIEIDVRKTPVDAIVASSNKCLEGVPGVGFVLCRREALDACEGNCHSLALDLYDQWKYMGDNGQWRFTPPTHVLAAFAEALRQHKAEGGVAGRGGRYRRNWERLLKDMKALGFKTFLPEDIQAPIIVTFYGPSDPNYDFQTFYKRVRDRGYILYPGKLTTLETFRFGCIGYINDEEIAGAVAAVSQVLKEMNIKEVAPAHTL